MKLSKLLAVAVLIPSLALAWQPTKPITVIFPNGPGAGNEISFRIVADQVEKRTGVSFVNEHRPGADGNIAMNHFATVPADGYTVAVPACQGNWVTAEIWYSNMVKYNAMEFEPVANIARSPLAFWAHPDSKVNTPEDLIREIRSRKRPINIAIGGAGHKLAVEYLVDNLKMSNNNLVATPMYKGPAQALLDVMG
jgi:tripartite-type tricarboxylate transporter receptor subunit TctC